MGRLSLTVLAFLVLALGVSLEPCRADGGGVEFPVATVGIAGRAVKVQLAATAQAQKRGLMYRQSLPEDEGMLFLYDIPKIRCMWMKNTLVPLTAAFLDGRGRILGFADMDPLTTQRHCSGAPIMYVLEMNRGWFARHGVREGDSLDLSGVAPPR
jgi:uncharacterized membrane protein (UPF0127 family)